MKYQPGDVVYWIERDKGTYQREVNFGIVDEEFSDAISVERLHIKDIRFINGVPYKDCPAYGKWHKLPKGWTYNTKLFEVTYEKLPDRLCELHWTKPEDVKTALAEGLLVFLKDYDQSVPRSEVDNKLGWRFRKEHDDFWYKFPHVSLYKAAVNFSFDFVAYSSYEEAAEKIRLIEAEWARQAALTDEEWSKEEIQRTIDRWIAVFQPSPEEIERAKDFLFNLERVEDVETRVYAGKMQWKYENKKRWLEIN